MQVQAKSTWRASPPVAAQEDCTLCQGTGWQLASTSGRSQARRCPCGILQRIVRLKEYVRIPQRYEHCTLDEYRPSTLSQFRALGEARRFASRFPRVEKGLFFVGDRGAGKTHLAVGILLDLLQRFQEDVLFFECQNLPGPGWPVIQRSEGRTPDLSRLRASSLLVLDDLDLDRASSEALSLTQEILWARLRSGKVTIFTADRPEPQMTPRGICQSNGNRARTSPPVLHPQFSLQLLNSVKVVPVTGEDFRHQLSGAGLLFSS